MGSWAQARSQARQLEGQTESLLQQYSQYASMTNVSPKPSDEEVTLEKQLEDIFERREATLSQLARHLDSASPSPATSAPSKPAIDPKKGHLARHRQILSQHRSDLAQLRHQLGEKRGRAQLFQSVRRDVDNYRATDPAAAEDEYMIQERGRIDRSNQEADSLLARAHAVNEGMGLQREQLERIRRKALDVAGMVPGVNGLIGRIASKRRRDGIILGSFIAICFLFVWFFS